MGIGLRRGSYARVGKGFIWENEGKEACENDSDVKKLHDDLEADMERLIKTLENAKAEDGSPLHSLQELSTCLAKSDERLKDLILENKKDIKKNQKLWALVERYYQLNEANSNLFDGLSNWVGRVTANQLLLEIALKFIEPANRPPGKAQYTKCKEKLKEYKTAENLLENEFHDLFNSVSKQYNQIWQELEADGKKSDKKYKWVRAWRKFSSIVFAAAFATVLICSFVAAVMTAPPLAAAIGAALPIGTIGECLNYQLKKYEKKIKVECEVIKTMQSRTFGGLHELKDIGTRVKGLEDLIKLILGSVDSYCKDEDNRQVAGKDIREKQKRFKDQINNLKDAVEYTREKRQSLKDTVEDTKKQNQSLKETVEDTKKQIQSLKQKMESLTTCVNLCERKIRDNCLEVVIKNIRCDV